MLLNHGLALSRLHTRTVLLCNNRLEPLSVNTLELFEKVFGYIKILIWLRSLLVQLLYAYVLVLWRHVKTVVVAQTSPETYFIILSTSSITIPS